SAPLPPPPPPAPSVPEVHRPPVERLEAVIALVEAGDFPHALLAAQRLVHDHPDDLGGLLTLGNIHALMGSPEAARESFTAALAREPLCVEARLYLGVAALQEGAAQEARAELKRALFLEPTLALGHYLLGQAEEQLGDKAAALRCYRNAVAQRKSGPRALLGHFPDLPRSTEAVAQAAQFRLSALADET
ncbi:MAG: tetratricopeptide repeat protein, partial [Myxococcaceae bacterium]|nr:tetratricopeptide repeat protein [Myxococcaceae bacterium]